MKTSEELQKDIEKLDPKKASQVEATLKLVEVMNRIADQLERINKKIR